MNTTTYTVFVRWTYREGDQTIEELDIEAGSREEARKRATEVLTRDYEPGFEIMRMVP